MIGLLLLLNLGLAVVGLGFMFWPVKPDAAVEFNGDKIKLVALPEVQPPAQPPTQELAPVPTTEAEPTVPALEKESAQAAAAPAPECLSWKRLDADAVQTLTGHLKRLGLNSGSYELRLAQRLGWWVYLPPLPDANAQRAAIEDARVKGITDLAPVRSGPLTNAVSLGAFPSLDKARAHAEVLAAKGLKGMKYAPRPEAGEVRLVLAGKPEGKVAEGLMGEWPKGLKPAACVPESP